MRFPTSVFTLRLLLVHVCWSIPLSWISSEIFEGFAQLTVTWGALVNLFTSDSHLSIQRSISNVFMFCNDKSYICVLT